MYFARKAFVSPEQLYLTTEHELLHVAHKSAGLMSSARGHASIYNWQYQQAEAWGLADLARSYKSQAGIYKQFFNRDYDWRNFCLDLCPSNSFLH